MFFLTESLPIAEETPKATGSQSTGMLLDEKPSDYGSQEAMPKVHHSYLGLDLEPQRESFLEGFGVLKTYQKALLCGS